MLVSGLVWLGPPRWEDGTQASGGTQTREGLPGPVGAARAASGLLASCPWGRPRAVPGVFWPAGAWAWAGGLPSPVSAKNAPSCQVGPGRGVQCRAWGAHVSAFPMALQGLQARHRTGLSNRRRWGTVQPFWEKGPGLRVQ